MDSEVSQLDRKSSLDSLEERRNNSFYNIRFDDIEHSVYSPSSDAELPKDHNLIKKAEFFRNLGNESFKRGFLESAIDHYTKAIQTYPHNHEFYTNRALCYKKKQKWDSVEADVRQALNLEENSVKAHYYLGQALINLGNPDEGMKKLRKAKALSEHYKIPYSEEIDNEILKAKKEIWISEDNKIKDAIDSLEEYISEVLAKQNSEGKMNDFEYAERLQQLNILNKYLAKTRERNVPSYLCCKISMCLMKDPVMTPSGQTYERKLIETHILLNGEYDPFTREPCRIADLLPNYTIKEAVQSFLEKNPWSYDDYYTG